MVSDFGLWLLVLELFWFVYWCVYCYALTLWFIVICIGFWFASWVALDLTFGMSVAGSLGFACVGVVACLGVLICDLLC